MHLESLLNDVNNDGDEGVERIMFSAEISAVATPTAVHHLHAQVKLRYQSFDNGDATYRLQGPRW